MKTTKFNALAYAIGVLGQPHQTGKDRCIEASHGVVGDAHLWRLPYGRWLVVDKWSDGDQCTTGSSGYFWARDNDDGSLCPEYEEQARALIDAFYDAWRLIDAYAEAEK